jgi:hypothetical protein
MTRVKAIARSLPRQIGGELFLTLSLTAAVLLWLV